MAVNHGEHIYTLRHIFNFGELARLMKPAKEVTAAHADMRISDLQEQPLHEVSHWRRKYLFDYIKRYIINHKAIYQMCIVK